jgi:hypothetical protein
MLTGKNLVDKLIDLEGSPWDEAMIQSGYTCLKDGKSCYLEDEFIKAVFEIALQYIEGVSKIQKQRPRKDRKPIFLMRLSGSNLLSLVALVDPSFESGPPWDKRKIDIVLKCGYVTIDENGSIKPCINAFHEAFLDAKDLERSRLEAESEGGSTEESDDEPPPFHIVSSSHSQQVIKSDADDEIGKAAIRLLSVADAVRKGCKGSASLVALQIEYSGCGDAGEIHAVEYLFSKRGSQDRDSDRMDEHGSASPPEKILFEGKTHSRAEYEEIISDSAFSISYNSHGSWFNDYGGSGFLTVYLDRRVICGEHVQDGDPTDPYFDGKAICPYYLWVKRV